MFVLTLINQLNYCKISDHLQLGMKSSGSKLCFLRFEWTREDSNTYNNYDSILNISMVFLNMLYCLLLPGCS